jgi:formate hydrogenlyase subunit 6/NADH:ubiquinone oxidoreductase subunit I
MGPQGRKREQMVRSIAVSAIFAFATAIANVCCTDSLDKVSVSGVSSQTAVVIDGNACIACAGRYCYEACPKRAIEETRLGQQIVYIIDAGKCIRCGVCIEKCPYHAIVWKH